MEQARKLVIVHEDTIERMRHEQAPNMQASSPSSNDQHPVQTRGDNQSKSDNKMYEILHSKNFSDDRRKLKNYRQVSRKYLFFKEAERADERNSEREIHEIRNTWICPHSSVEESPIIAQAMESPRARPSPVE